MKFKKMMLAVFLVGLLTISAVTAANNATDDTGFVEKTVDEVVNDNWMIGDNESDEGSDGDSSELSDLFDDEMNEEDIDLTVGHKKIMTGDDYLSVDLSDFGPISILVDGREVYKDNYYLVGGFCTDDLLRDFDYGNHTLEVKYLGGQYDPTFYKSTFFYSYVDLYADSNGHIIIESEEEMNAKLYLDGDLIYDGNIDYETVVSGKNLYQGYVPNYTLVTKGKGKYNAITLTDALNYEAYLVDVPSTMGKGDDRYINFTMPPDAKGNLKVYLNDIDVNATFENGKSIIPLNTLDIGDYNVHIAYDSDSKYGSYNDYYDMKVTYNPNFKVTLPAVAYLTESTITFTGSKDVDGKISINTGMIDRTFKGDYKNGIAKIKIFDEESGPKTYSYIFEGIYAGEKFEYNGEFNITLTTLCDVSLPKTVYSDFPFEATFTGPQSMNGEISSLYFKDDFVEVRKGKATVTIEGLKAGVNIIDYDFTDSNGNMYYSSFKVNVIKLPIDVSLPKTVYEGHSFKATFTGLQSMNGKISSSYFKDYDVDVKKGKATITVNGLKAGVKTIKYDFTDSKGNMVYLSFKVNVIKLPIIKANDFKKMYSSKKAYQVRILNNQSKSIGAGMTVTFYLYKAGKVASTKTSKTDSKGYAKVNFNVAPGTYKIKTKYGLTKVTKKYTVNPILSIKEVRKHKIIRSGLSQLVTAKKFVFQANLKKVDGKYLKGKKVKITFYKQFAGKEGFFKVYSATKKIGSKGVVKFTYKKLPFKVTSNELNGWIIAVKISYFKENVWGSLNVDSQSPPKYYFMKRMYSI